MKKKVFYPLLFILPTLFLPKSSLAGMEIDIDFPLPGMQLDYTSPITPLAGYLYITGSHKNRFKVIIALDTSSSTAAPCGRDLDNDGIVGLVPTIYRETEGLIGESNTDPDDSIFTAEILATQRLVQMLDPDTTEVGVISFGGDLGPGGNRSNVTTPDAYLEQPLTNKYSDIAGALNRIKTQGASGATNIAESIRLGIELLRGLKNNTHSNDGSKRIILLLSDGFPTFPAGSADVADPEDKILTISAAHLAYLAGIQINTYALGPEALSSPFTLQEIARVTGGHFTGLLNPGKILTHLEDTSFIQLQKIVIENITLTKPASEMLITPEGFFVALVPLAEGLNKLRVSVKATDGSVTEKLLPVYWFKPDVHNNITLQLNLARDRLRELKLTLAREKERLMRYGREKLDLELQIKPKNP